MPRFTVLLEGEPSARQRFWMLWTGFSLGLNLNFLVHWAFLQLWWVPQSLPLKNSPTAWGWYQHTLLLGRFSADDEQSWFPSNMMLTITVHQNRESCFSESEGPLGAFFANSKCVFMCLRWGEDCIWPHQHKAQIGGLLQWCLSFCGFLLSPHMIMELNWVTIRFLVTTLTKDLLHQFGQEDSSKKNPGCFKLLPLRVMETTCFCETSMKQNCFQNCSPDL